MTTAATDPPPDWATTTAACPMCDYNLHGLADPRCPECGFVFRWAELLDDQRTRHRYLFEHARPGRRVRAFLKTYAMTALPRRFWRDVSPANLVRLRRLIVYWFLTSVTIFFPVAIALPLDAVAAARINQQIRATWVRLPGEPSYYLCRGTNWTMAADDFEACTPGLASPRLYRSVIRRGSGSLWAAGATVAAWPWATMASLLVFQASMRKAKVSITHLVRVSVYGCESTLLALIITIIIAGPAAIFRPIIDLVHLQGLPPWVTSDGLFGRDCNGELLVLLRFLRHWDVSTLMFVVLAIALASTYRLSVAYRRYMRFDRPMLTVLASQAIVFLAALVIGMRLLQERW